MNTNWSEAVRGALIRITHRHNSPEITRQQIIDEELSQIIREVDSRGKTPKQTLSRVLQEMRDEGSLAFESSGHYLLLEKTPIKENTLLSDEAATILVKKNLLRLGNVETGERTAMTASRRGQEKIRTFILEIYGKCCCLCDVTEPSLLIASHIARWADEPDARGDLTNVLCLCRMHDALFETGHFSISDRYDVLKRRRYKSQTIHRLLENALSVRIPSTYTPAARFLVRHRFRWKY